MSEVGLPDSSEPEAAGLQVSQQNARGQWVPAIPEPLFVGWRLRHCRCNCGQTFKDRVTYRGHYALVHILAVPR